MDKSIKWYDGEMLVAIITYTGEWPIAKLKSYQIFTEDKFQWPLLVKDSAHLNALFESRQAPRKNFGAFAKEYFRMNEYHAENMCRVSHGTMPHDTFWMKFENDRENLSWSDVSLDYS